jgi:hypothetical protein
MMGPFFQGRMDGVGGIITTELFSIKTPGSDIAKRGHDCSPTITKSGFFIRHILLPTHQAITGLTFQLSQQKGILVIHSIE